MEIKQKETVEDREAWSATVHGVAEWDMNQQLNNTKKELSGQTSKRRTWRRTNSEKERAVLRVRMPAETKMRYEFKYIR